MYAFLGDKYFLSNGYDCPLVYEEIEYPSAEAAYNAQKSEDIEIRKQFCTMNWKQARDYGQEVKLRDGWDDMRDEIMLNVIRAKFKNNKLRERLLMTRTEHLEEANDFGDTYWGTVDGKGLNKLGEILMQVRRELYNTQYLTVLKQKSDDIDLQQWYVNERFEKYSLLNTVEEINELLKEAKKETWNCIGDAVKFEPIGYVVKAFYVED